MTTQTITLQPGDSVTINAPATGTPPVQPPIQPPTQPPGTQPVGIELRWLITSNSPRSYVLNARAGDVRHFWFKTPAAGNKGHTIRSSDTPPGQAAQKIYTVADSAGNLVYSQLVGSASINFKLSPDSGQGYFTILPDAYYTLTVTVPATEGPGDYTYYIDMLNG